jgi:hypothetical protein
MPIRTRSSKKALPTPSTSPTEDHTSLLTDPTHVSDSEDGRLPRAVVGDLQDEIDKRLRAMAGGAVATDSSSVTTPHCEEATSPSVATSTTVATSSLSKDKMIDSLR